MLGLKDSNARKNAGDALEVAQQTARKIDEQERTIETVKEEVSALGSKIDSLAKSSEGLAAQTTQVLAAVRQLRDDVEEEMSSLKLSKNKMISAVVDKVQQEMEQLTSTVKQDFDSYLAIKKELGALSSRLSLTSQEIDKFRAISTAIKAMDFEMRGYARVLEEKDSEKLRLIRRIEELQKIISRERRVRR